MSILSLKHWPKPIRQLFRIRPAKPAKLIHPEFVDVLRHEFVLDINGVHGIPHWSRVRLNALMLAKETGADTEVIEYFSFLHDIARLSEDGDPSHGPRAVNLIKARLWKHLYLNDDQMEILFYAIAGHSEGLTSDDATVATCWDADRMDLNRIGIEPNPELLSTISARNPNNIMLANVRAKRWANQVYR